MWNRELWIWALAILAVIANAFFASYNVDAMAESAKRIAEAKLRSVQFEDLLRGMLDAETAHRGFILTGNEEFLDPYHRSRQELDPTLDGIKGLTAPDQLGRLRDLINRKYAEMERTIALRRANQMDDAIALIKSGVGKRLMDDIRTDIRDSMESEGMDVAAAEADAMRQASTARFTIIVSTMLALGIILAAAMLIRNELQRRLKANDALQFAKSQLETAYASSQRNERLFRQLAESMPQMVWMCAPSGAFDYLNQRWEKYTGRPRTGDLAEAWRAGMAAEDRERVDARWAYSLLSGETFEIDYRLARYDGVQRWFLGRATAARNADGQIEYWVGTLTDIDDTRRLAENLERTVQERTAMLTEQRTFLDAILNNISEGIVACDAQGTLLFNRATQDMHGLAALEIPPDQWSQHYSLYDWDSQEPLKPEQVPLARARAGERVQDVQMRIVPANGNVRYLLCSGVPLINSAGRTFGAVVSMRDVTERRSYEMQMLESAKSLRASNEELEKFAYIASHDLQEPLRKIQAFGDRLAKRAREGLDDDSRDSLQRILDSAGRMRRLIEDLLAYSRVSTKIRPFERVDLNTVVEDIENLFEMRLTDTGGSIMHDTLPTIMGDDSQLRQLFQNLVGNALKFTKPGEPPRVEIRAEPLSQVSEPPPAFKEGWRVSVRDYGIGFEQQYADRIFELFQRLHGRLAYEGTGLGLAIVKKIAARHGIEVQCRSQPDQGAAFFLDWPSSPRGA